MPLMFAVVTMKVLYGTSDITVDSDGTNDLAYGWTSAHASTHLQTWTELPPSPRATNESDLTYYFMNKFHISKYIPI